MLAYKTAYLKAHYPVEFMAATLTCESGEIDNVVRFVDEARKMGIEVLPPSVGRSRPEFTVEQGKVRYGLAAVRGVGEKAAEAIVAAREEHGEFKSFYDFCDTVDLHTVNRQVAETLVKCGAFDEFGVRRAQLALVLEAALRVGATAQEDRERGQMALFGGTEDPETERAAVAAMPHVAEWPESTLLAREREALGLYISSHPLASHETLLRAFSTADAAGAAEAEDGAPIFIGGIVEGLRITAARRGPSAGKKMARFTVEDLSGNIACVMFGEDLERCSSLLVNGSPLFLRGFVSHRNGEPSIRVSEVFPFDKVRAKFTDSIVLSLEEDLASEATFAEIKAVLERNPGGAAVYLEVADEDGRTVVLEAGTDLRVAVSDALCRDLAELIGAENIRLKPKPDRTKSNRPRSWPNGRNGERRNNRAGANS